MMMQEMTMLRTVLPLLFLLPPLAMLPLLWVLIPTFPLPMMLFRLIQP
jgi:hypothetical protein